MSPGRALDVGTGEGADALWLAEHGWDVTATDISANALARLQAEAERRGVDITVMQSDVNDLQPYGEGTFDLVSVQYGSFTRTPDDRAIRGIIDAVAPEGTLLVVHHDLTGMRGPIDPKNESRRLDFDAYVSVGDFADVLAGEPEKWEIEVHDTRPRPAGAVSTHLVDDVVLRARRRR